MAALCACIRNCIFSSVVIEGTSLGAGTHSYCELVGAYAANIAAGGSGSITVRPYGLAPIVATHRRNRTWFMPVGARDFSVGAIGGTPLSYQWRKEHGEFDGRWEQLAAHRAPLL